jgi:hypothetical protein
LKAKNSTGKQKFFGFLIKSANKKKKQRKKIFLSERLNSKYAIKKFYLNKQKINMAENFSF